MDNELLVQSIRNLCKSNNISISQLENELKFGAGLVSRWVKSSPSIDKVVDIADYFHVSLDEVVGYHNVINDKFLEKLIQQTEDKTIQWNKYLTEDSNNLPKQYHENINYEFISQQDAEDFFFNHAEISYYVKIQESYVSLYGTYDHQNILNPSDLKLFIQPNDDANLIEQFYSYEQIKALWLKVLYSLGENAPDEIKVEEFKNAFVNKCNTNNFNRKTSANDTAILKLMETYNTEEFQKLRKTFENPEFQAAIQAANAINEQLNKMKEG